VVENYSERERRRRTVVDAGCGEGRDTIFLLEKGFRVFALDASPRNISIVLQNPVVAKAPPEMFRSYVVDLVAEKVPIKDATADAVLDVWVLGSVILRHDGRSGAKQYLGEAHRILKPGGLFVSEFETIKPRRSSDKLKVYFANLVKGRFSVVVSEAIRADYPLYQEIPSQRKLWPALFVVACRE